MLGELLTAGATLASGAYSARSARQGQQEANALNLQEAKRNREFQAREAQYNRNFQERLSSSAYQRSMADMRKAGLNPMLAFMKGGASTPAGNAASGSQGRVESTTAKSAEIMSRLIPSVIQTLNTQAETAKKLAEQKNIEAQTRLTNEKTWLTEKQAQEIANKIHIQVPKVMEAYFQADLYEYVQEKLGVVPTNLTPGALIKFVQQNAAAFLVWRRTKGRKITTTTNTMKTPSGSHTVKIQK